MDVFVQQQNKLIFRTSFVQQAQAGQKSNKDFRLLFLP
jgi:hypothetical protein